MAKIKGFLSSYSSRKFLIYMGVSVSASWLLIRSKGVEPPLIPGEEYVSLIIWMTLLYFGANIWQTQAQAKDEEPVKQRPLSVRMLNERFLATLGALCFFTYATWSKVLDPSHYVTLNIWISGLYFGVDVADIYAFRKNGNLGDFVARVAGGGTATATVSTSSTKTVTITDKQQDKEPE